jgi:hypothetical protein
MHHVITSVLARLHAASTHLCISPDLSQDILDGRDRPAERIEGSTACAVAGVVDMYSRELLDSAHALHELQRQLDKEQEGYVGAEIFG